jgi:glutamyl-tRNA reductase
MFLVDIAVPRDIEPTVHGLANVYLYNIDDLQKVVEENLKARQGEAARAEAIVESEVESFGRWLRQKEVAPTIQALRDRMESIRAAEIDRIDSRLADLTPDQKDAVEEATRRLVNKILHRPLKGIKEVLHQPDGLARVEAIRKLFGIEDR